MILLDPFFQSGMVLPRNERLPFWGIAEPGRRICLSIQGREAETLSNSTGVFKLWLSPLEAGGPFSLRVWVPENGEEQQLEDVWVGEVWFASGQSNMSMTVEACERHREEMLADADYPQLRLFTVERKSGLTPESSVSGKWQPCQPETVKEFSAVAFGFAKSLHLELEVPVGVVVSAWGGTFIETWISQQGLSRLPEFHDWAENYRQEAYLPERWQAFREKGDAQGMVSNLPEDAGNEGLDLGWAGAEFDDGDWEKMVVPGKWQSNGYPGSGVFWFRQRFDLPASWLGKTLVLETGAMDKIDITYANGQEIGRTGEGHDTSFWNQPRKYSLPGELIQDAKVSLAVRVVSFSGDGGMIGPATKMGVYPEGAPEERIPITGEWKFKQEQDYGVVSTAGVMGHCNHNSPHILFDNMVAPLLPFPFKGVIWYQGESNAGRSETYPALLRTLIADWRFQFARPDLGFYIVQLPEFMAPIAYQEGSNWARMREGQRQVAQLPGVGMAVTLGYGEEDDIHPQNKLPVGELLARSALVEMYGKEGVPGGPILADVRKEAEKIICSFDQVGEGLCAQVGEHPDGFYVADAIGVFHPANSKIVSPNEVEVCSDQVSDPQQIRYAWSDHPINNHVLNSDKIPASPFGFSL